jgi:hypothetical protein
MVIPEVRLEDVPGLGTGTGEVFCRGPRGNPDMTRFGNAAGDRKSCRSKMRVNNCKVHDSSYFQYVYLCIVFAAEIFRHTG